LKKRGLRWKPLKEREADFDKLQKMNREKRSSALGNFRILSNKPKKNLGSRNSLE